MKKNLRFVGLDVHKDSIAVAVADSGREPARLLETIAADEVAAAEGLDRLGPEGSAAGVLRGGSDRLSFGAAAE